MNKNEMQEYIKKQEEIPAELTCDDESCTHYGGEMEEYKKGLFRCNGTLDGENYGTAGCKCIEQYPTIDYTMPMLVR